MDEVQVLLKERVNQAQKVLVGIGEEFNQTQWELPYLTQAYDRLARILDNCDYYIVTLQEDEQIKLHTYDLERVVAPGVDGEVQWKKYQEWLAYTLNQELVILELGVGFSLPNIIRWPFEKIAFFNQKAHLFRIHGNFYQLSSELGEKGTSIKQNSVEFCANL